MQTKMREGFCTKIVLTMQVFGVKFHIETD